MKTHKRNNNNNYYYKKEPAKLLIWLSRLTTDRKSKKTRDKYLEVDRELKYLWNMKVVVLEIVKKCAQKDF